MRRALQALLVAALLVPAVGSAGACLGGGTLEARVEAEPVELSARDNMKELRFVAEASTSDVIADGLVSVSVRAADGSDASEGQVRVTVGRGDGFMEDPAARDDVVKCTPDASVEIPREALAGCQGTCREPFVAVFAAEGLEPGVTVSLPVVLEAQVVYENAIEPGPADSLRLILEE